MASSVPTAWSDVSDMTARELTSELDRTRGWLERIELKLNDMDPVWLHPPMDDDDEIERVFDAAVDKLRAQRTEDEAEGSPDLIDPHLASFGFNGLFFVTGPYSETDAQVVDMAVPPSGSYHYMVHLYSEIPAPNQNAPPEITITKEPAVWTVFTNDKGVAVEMGIMYQEDLYDDIQGVVRSNRHPNGQLAILLENQETSEKVQRRRREASELAERVKELELALDRVTGRIKLVVVSSDAHLPVAFHDRYRLPGKNEYGATVGEAFGCIGIRNGKGARIFIGDYTLVDNDSLYDTFLADLAQMRPQPVTVLVIEPPTAAELKGPEGKKRRTEGALVLLHSIEGSDTADGERLAVALLPAMEGLVVVNRDTKQRVCEHVHPLDVVALSVRQQATGRSCPQCTGGGGG